MFKVLFFIGLIAPVGRLANVEEMLSVKYLIKNSPAVEIRDVLGRSQVSLVRRTHL
jgi:hypothetical protein